jgi:hypothetical protein
MHEMDVVVVGPTTTALDNLAEEWRAAVKANSASALAASFSDRRVPNLSSIALHIRHAGRTALLTGDARGDYLLEGLEAAELLAADGTIHVDVFKLPHHGSQENAAPALFERIHADHYVISADGVRYKHPSASTLEWLVHSRPPKDDYKIHLTNPIPAAQATLEELRVGRSFTVSVGAPHVEIALADINGDKQVDK